MLTDELSYSCYVSRAKSLERKSLSLSVEIYHFETKISFTWKEDLKTVQSGMLDGMLNNVAYQITGIPIPFLIPFLLLR